MANARATCLVNQKMNVEAHVKAQGEGTERPGCTDKCRSAVASRVVHVTRPTNLGQSAVGARKSEVNAHVPKKKESDDNRLGEWYLTPDSWLGFPAFLYSALNIPYVLAATKSI